MTKNKSLVLYIFWIYWVSSRSLISAFFISSFCSLMLYISKGSVSLDKEVFNALLEVMWFCFPIVFSLTYIISFLLVFKALLHVEFKNLHVEIYNCKFEPIKEPNLSDITTLWRKWLFVTFWILIFIFVLFVGISKLFFSDFSILSFINGFSVYVLISLIGAGVFSFGLQKSKQVGVIDA